MMFELPGPIGGVGACEDTTSSDDCQDEEAVMDLYHNCESFSRPMTRN